MLSKLTPKATVALAQLAQLSRWGEVNTMIDAELAAIFQRMLGATDVADLHELRGRAKALQEFQTLVRDAPAVLVKQGLNSPM